MFCIRWIVYISIASFSYLSAKDAVNHDDDEALQRVENGKEDLEEGRSAVGDGEHGGHPGEGQQRQDHAGAPQRRPVGQERNNNRQGFRKQVHS